MTDHDPLDDHHGQGCQYAYARGRAAAYRSAGKLLADLAKAGTPVDLASLASVLADAAREFDHYAAEVLPPEPDVESWAEGLARRSRDAYRRLHEDEDDRG